MLCFLFKRTCAVEGYQYGPTLTHAYTKTSASYTYNRAISRFQILLNTWSGCAHYPRNCFIFRAKRRLAALHAAYFCAFLHIFVERSCVGRMWHEPISAFLCTCILFVYYLYLFKTSINNSNVSKCPHKKILMNNNRQSADPTVMQWVGRSQNSAYFREDSDNLS